MTRGEADLAHVREGAVAGVLARLPVVPGVANGLVLRRGRGAVELRALASALG